MVEKASTMLSLGTKAPDFSLPNVLGGVVAREDFAQSKALLVMFICNHCPFVIHVREELVRLGRDYMPKGVGIVAISANNIELHPADSPEKMAEVARSAAYPFPYCYDASQAVAKAYRASCTPDFFLFDSDLCLVYRGQLDNARPGNGVPVTGADLRAALDAALAGEPPLLDQRPSIGCNIKWKPGNEPDYFKG